MTGRRPIWCREMCTAIIGRRRNRLKAAESDAPASTVLEPPVSEPSENVEFPPFPRIDTAGARAEVPIGGRAAITTVEPQRSGSGEVHQAGVRSHISCKSEAGGGSVLQRT